MLVEGSKPGSGPVTGEPSKDWEQTLLPMKLHSLEVPLSGKMRWPSQSEAHAN